jgi:hypothetical protein
MLSIVKSTLITLLISFGIGFAFRNVFGFWESFVLTSILQYIIAFTVKNIAINKTNKIIQELATDIEDLLENQQVNVTCPCGNNTIPVIVMHNEDIIVECDKCNNTFKVIPEITTQLVTEPLNMENIYNKLKEQQYNQV